VIFGIACPNEEVLREGQFKPLLKPPPRRLAKSNRYEHMLNPFDYTQLRVIIPDFLRFTFGACFSSHRNWLSSQ
jgi:hypothetical protein